MAAVVKLTLNKAALASVAIAAVEPDLYRRGNRVKNYAQRIVQVDTGRLRASITVVSHREKGTIVIRIGSNLSYARAAHDGTGIYGPRGRPIRPRSARFLRFRPSRGSAAASRDGYVYARQVSGMKGSRYLLLGLRKEFGAAA